MYLHRFYIGGPKRPANESVALVLKEYGLDGATIYDATGLWKGELEPVIVVEVVSSSFLPDEEIATSFAESFDQEEVLYTLASVGGGFARR